MQMWTQPVAVADSALEDESQALAIERIVQ
jgi:hypothetical protein